MAVFPEQNSSAHRSISQPLLAEFKSWAKSTSLLSIMVDGGRVKGGYW